jgi:hypothetical protein
MHSRYARKVAGSRSRYASAGTVWSHRFDEIWQKNSHEPCYRIPRGRTSVSIRVGEEVGLIHRILRKLRATPSMERQDVWACLTYRIILGRLSQGLSRSSKWRNVFSPDGARRVPCCFRALSTRHQPDTFPLEGIRGEATGHAASANSGRATWEN